VASHNVGLWNWVGFEQTVVAMAEVFSLCSSRVIPVVLKKVIEEDDGIGNDCL
jgi:hypothetical protein